MSLPGRYRRILVACCLLPVAGFFVLSLLSPLPPAKPYSLLIEDREGRFLHAFLADDGIWRLRTSPQEIQDRVKELLVQREDRWFYAHRGVNPFSLVRALIQNFATGRRISGASTITMQVARMLEPKDRTYLSKCIEIFRAFQLELKYSKRELLELYLSMVPLGGNIEGLKSAALLYYQTPLERLNVAQLMDLMLIPGDPNGLRPDHHPSNLLEERLRTACRWLRGGLLTECDSVILWNTTAAARRTELPRFAPHFCQRVRDQHPTGPEVRSSLDLSIQHTVERLLSNHLRQWKMKGVRNGAVIVLKNRTGEILAYAGSEDFSDADARGQVDGARAVRSPGSILKPLLYAYAMDLGVLSPRSSLLDTPYDAEGFLAENYDGKYSGLVSAGDALRRSLNVPMIRLLRSTGFSGFLEFLSGAGISFPTAAQSRLGLSMILGGCGVTLEQVTTAYATFPRGGTFLPASFVAVDSACSRIRVFSPSAAFMVTDILSGLDRPDLPNNIEYALNLPAVAFKTGTSYGRRDAWSIGYSCDFTVGVWIGNVDNTGNPELVGSKSAAPLLIEILNSITVNPSTSILPVPRDIGMRMVCARSGLLPTPQCDRCVEDYYSRTRSLSRQCTVCKEYMISPDRRFSYCTSCVNDRPYRSEVFQDFAPELLQFWQTAGIRARIPPPHNPLCTRVFAGDGPIIVSPSDGMTYYLAGRDQKLFLRASSALDVREHVWYVDGRFVARRRAGETLFASIGGGDHTVICVDDRGRSSRIQILVKTFL